MQCERLDGHLLAGMPLGDADAVFRTACGTGELIAVRLDIKARRPDGALPS
ncbi:hypothetical protein WKI71_42755 [Streptomyces sp. MS1.AVA.1]|uniref:Uncharacterized protein n=1 Tax=Streptomyces machairae TaxID=3134109 RepID=A0ABU8UUQ9_9ACTN